MGAEKIKLQLSVDATLEQILGDDRGCAVFDRMLPGIRASVEGRTNMMGMPFRTLVKYSNGAIPAELLPVMDQALRTITIEIEAPTETVYDDKTPLAEGAREVVRRETPLDAVYPGQVMRDTEGKRIQAHGGALFYEDGTYYLYGENKDHTDGKCHVWTWGMRAYRSTDLYNWEDLGLFIPPVFDDKDSGLYPESRADRPHILKCPTTGKYVCWIKHDACFLVMEADAFLGPYHAVRENYKPDQMAIGDYDMLTASDGRGYLFVVGNSDGIYGYRLAEDYCSVTECINRSYTGLHAPFCREGVCLFERGGKIYMITSGMTGYIPNRSDAAVTESWEKEFCSIGDPHVADETKASFNSQISQVFQLPGKDRYITIADRWLPGYRVTGEMADAIERFVANHFEPEKYPVQPGDKEIYMQADDLESANTSIADYVWLPLTFDENGLPRIAWLDRWQIES